jgi:dipeptidyl aminopeptidase/acylaminoacyl peptidase
MKVDLERIPIPGADEAEQRAWQVVSRGYTEYRPQPAHRRRRRPVLIAAVAVGLGALIAAAVSPAGSEIVHSVREAVGLKTAAPALSGLPAGGQLLVTSTEGPWIVQPDGSKRLLGGYREASWSPHGLYVAVTRTHELLAVDPHGTAHWSLARAGTLSLPRWSPDGYRIAYLDGSNLRMVAGDGTGDRLFAKAVAPVAPAWRPSLTNEHVLAFASAGGELELYAVDTNTLLARHPLTALPLQLVWSTDGERLVALTPRGISIFDHDGRPLGSIRVHRQAVAAAFEPQTHQLAVILGGGRSDAVAFDVDRPRRPAQEIFGGTGRFSGLAWSPDRKWLLLAWPTADQWVFVHNAPGQRIAAVSEIARQFNPGHRRVAFPTLDGWCCAP